ncbi:MAG: alpha-E domain-containing protein [Verrucomicrobiota bacterium]|nr:alpha-E domain-containing protein [Verrucomicrobiota bacterium]
MLSRVADNMFWMSRYVERAEGVTRLVEVNRDTNLESNPSADYRDYWKSALNAMCALEDFAKDEINDEEKFILFSDKWASSLVTCINMARENGRMIRDQLSEEIWVELNNLYLFLNSPTLLQQFAQDPDNFFRRVIRFSLVFQGLSDATIHQDEGWRFMSLGKYLERSDQTSRVLDTLTLLEGDPTRLDLIAALKSCSALSAFRKRYPGELNLRNVADFLLFSKDFPRSLRFTVGRIDILLHEISGIPSGNFSNEAERLSGSALAQLNFSDIDSLLLEGLHESIDQLQRKLIEVGQSIFETYVLLPFEIKNASMPIISQRQMQQQ